MPIKDAVGQAVSKIKDQGLQFAVVILGGGALGTVGGIAAGKLWVGVVSGAVPVVAGLIALWMFYRHQNQAQDRQVGGTVRELKADLETARKTIGTLKEQLDSPGVKVITKRDYGAILAKWDEAGLGHLLLYNIELQSFENEEEITNTWGDLAKLKNIKSVVLLLPTLKVHRWEQVVLREENNFFADPANRKFEVCEIAQEQGGDSESVPTGIAFALYRFGDDPDGGELHDSAAVFVLCKPFSVLHQPYLPEDSEWWDYQQILLFTHTNRELITRADAIWRRYFDRTRMRTVERVLQDAKPLKPIEPSVLFDRLRVSKPRKTELLKHFEPRQLLAGNPADPARVPQDRNKGPFTLAYDNGETIEGHYSGVDVDTKTPKPCIIWVGGFTEHNATALASLFEHVLKKESVVQFYYEVSPPIEFITLTRYAQDMREVLRYVNKQREVVVRDQLVLIARSINGLLAALVAAEKEFLQMLTGVILVAPVFDVIEMMDNYRARRGQGHVRVENCWRVSPGYHAQRWENQEHNWLEFFEHHVSLTAMADIIRYEEGHFRFEAFKQAVGKISHSCPVYVMSHPKDPITASEEAIKALKNASSGTDLIHAKNYRYVPILSSHLPPDTQDSTRKIRKDKYPFELRGEAKEARDALHEIMTKMRLPTLDEATLADDKSAFGEPKIDLKTVVAESAKHILGAKNKGASSLSSGSDRG